MARQNRNKTPFYTTRADATTPVLCFKRELEKRVREVAKTRRWSQHQLTGALRLAYDLASETGSDALVDLGTGMERIVWEAFVETTLANPQLQIGTFWGQKTERFERLMAERTENDNVESLDAHRKRRFQDTVPTPAIMAKWAPAAS